MGTVTTDISRIERSKKEEETARRCWPTPKVAHANGVATVRTMRHSHFITLNVGASGSTLICAPCPIGLGQFCLQRRTNANFYARIAMPKCIIRIMRAERARKESSPKVAMRNAFGSVLLCMRFGAGMDAVPFAGLVGTNTRQTGWCLTKKPGRYSRPGCHGCRSLSGGHRPASSRYSSRKLLRNVARLG